MKEVRGKKKDAKAKRQEIRKTGVLVFFLTSCFFFLSSVFSSACDCAFQTPQAHFDQAKVVFIGKVLDVQSSWGQLEVKFQVSEFQKAEENDQEEKVLVYTGLNEAECGYTFEKDGVYQVFVSKDNDRFTTSLCSGNQRLRGLEE